MESDVSDLSLVDGRKKSKQYLQIKIYSAVPLLSSHSPTCILWLLNTAARVMHVCTALIDILLSSRMLILKRKFNTVPLEYIVYNTVKHLAKDKEDSIGNTGLMSI